MPYPTWTDTPGARCKLIFDMTVPATPDTAPRLVALGEALIDVVPATPGASLADDGLLQPWPGGAPANVAVAAAKLGAISSFVGAVGSDAFGARLRRVLTAAGVDVSGVVTVDSPTAVAFVALAADGEREFTFYGRPAAHDMLTAADVEAWVASRPFTAADILHLGSNCLAREPARSASLRAVSLARRAGAGVAFDLNLRLPLWDQPTKSEVLAAMKSVVEHARLVKLSLDELEYVTGRRDMAAAEELAADLLSGSAELLSVTLGAEGAWYVIRGGRGHVRGFAMDASDTTGAGDAFMGSVIATSLLEPQTWADTTATEEALRRACAYAALSTTRPGGFPSYGAGLELNAFLARHTEEDGGQHGR